MSDPSNHLTLASPDELAGALAFALWSQGRRRRRHSADEIVAHLVARRLVKHLERSGFIFMKRPLEIGAAALDLDFDG